MPFPAPLPCAPRLRKSRHRSRRRSRRYSPFAGERQEAPCSPEPRRSAFRPSCACWYCTRRRGCHNQAFCQCPSTGGLCGHCGCCGAVSTQEESAGLLPCRHRGLWRIRKNSRQIPAPPGGHCAGQGQLPWESRHRSHRGGSFHCLKASGSGPFLMYIIGPEPSCGIRVARGWEDCRTCPSSPTSSCVRHRRHPAQSGRRWRGPRPQYRDRIGQHRSIPQ